MIKDILHLKAPKNWINDPNGFIYYKGTYHLFYQHFPYAPVWGTMHWGHAVSDDLIHWEHQEVAVFPTKEYDQNGIFSGSSLEIDGRLVMYYSGIKYMNQDSDNIHVSEGEQFESCQAMITSQDGYCFHNWADKKQIIPVILEDEMGDRTHTRDPKVWKYKECYYMVLGSTYKEKIGRVLFYKSQDGITWEYVSQYRNPHYGTIIECPDLFQVNETYVFIGCPMNIVADGLQYTQHAVCAVAEYKEEECQLQLPDDYQYVDYGLDLYAPQTSLDEEGSRVMIGWMRMPKAVKSVEKERGLWNGMMTAPRIVEVEHDHVYFRIHPRVSQYFCQVLADKNAIDFEAAFWIEATLEEGEVISIGGYVIKAEQGHITTDRSAVFDHVEGYHMKSRTPTLYGGYHLDVLIEPNLIEVFVNNGEYVISNVVYGLKKEIKGNIGQIKTGR